MTGEMTTAKPIRAMNPHKFAMWLFLVSVVMIFISLSSAYIVKKSMGDWIFINFPPIFQYTSLVIVLSSITMHWAYVSAKHNNLLMNRLAICATAVLAAVFVAGQVYAWGQLVEGGLYFVGNAASSFIYIFTGLHIVHLVGALIFLFVVLYESFKYKVHSKSMLNIELCTTLWHFLGGLWVYLYLFLIFNN